MGRQLRLLLPVTGIVMATPLADALCCFAANLMFAAYIRHLKGNVLDNRHLEILSSRA